MVAWWKRVLFSLASMVAAVIVCLSCVVLESVLKSHPANIHSSEVILTIAVAIGFCMVGWVFALPVVLIVTNIRKGRFWFYWVLGSCVGPLLMVALSALVFIVFPQCCRWSIWRLLFQASRRSSICCCCAGRKPEPMLGLNRI
jgi:hypothetical protein